MKRIEMTIGVLLILAASCAAQDASRALYPLAAGSASPGVTHARERALKLVQAMTIEEKLQLVHGTGRPIRGAGFAGKIAGIPRLGIPDIVLADGPSGVGNGAQGVTAFPAPVVVAASWDRALSQKYGKAIGQEHADKGHSVALAPTVNILRVPEWGRAFETLGEDPVLSGEIAKSAIMGIQSKGVIASVKHLAANNQEHDRTLVDVQIGERALREIYLPAFETAVKEAGVLSVMCAYNKVNGDYACENKHLETGILKDDWKFPGFVMSDWDATHSTEKQANAGLDMEMPFGPKPDYPEYFGEPLKNAIAHGSVSISRLDDMATRILTSIIGVGILDREQPTQVKESVSTPEHRELSRVVAESGAVLLKNSGVLPIEQRTVHSIAVIGAAASDVPIYTGGGSSFVNPSETSTPLDGIRARVGSRTRVSYTPGTAGTAVLPNMPGSAVQQSLGEASGFRVSYYASPDFTGSPVLRRVESKIDLSDQANAIGDAEAVAVREDASEAEFPLRGRMWSARWEAAFTPTVTGLHRFSINTYGVAKLYIDGKLVISNYGKDRSAVEHAVVQLVAGKQVALRLDYVADLLVKRRASLQLGWLPANTKLLQDAVNAAAKSDIAIVFVNDVRTEGGDVSTLALPGDQNALIEAVAQANSRTIVVLNTGGPVLMPWKGQVAGILEGWYPGQENGKAIASILFGDTNPSGKLPFTFPGSDTLTPVANSNRWPGVNDVVHYDENLLVGYRWYDEKHQEPLFPFGFGLSYTTFTFSELRHIRGTQGIHVITARVRNTGATAGAEVVQLYLGFPAAAGEPPLQLKAFEKIFLNPGESRLVTFRIGANDLHIWNSDRHAWETQSGRYEAFLGNSSRNLPLHIAFHVSPE